MTSRAGMEEQAAAEADAQTTKAPIAACRHMADYFDEARASRLTSAKMMSPTVTIAIVP